MAVGHPFDNDTENIWKYVVKHGVTEHEIPEGGEIVHVGMDPLGNTPAVWAKVNQTAPRETRRFTFIGTGHEFPENAKYLGSAHQPGFIWHVVELP